MTFQNYEAVFDSQTGRTGHVVSTSEDGKIVKVRTPFGIEERPAEKLSVYISNWERNFRDMHKTEYWESRFEGLSSEELREIAMAARIYSRHSALFRDLNSSEVELMGLAADEIAMER